MKDFTEEQAQHKMCPLTTLGDQIGYCTGSFCMWWEWTERNSKLADDAKGYNVTGVRGKCSQNKS